jgi:catechol 2,3-dioxygenase-like lactoylglutathione lyase family enzyme
VEQRIGLVTLGVNDLARSRAFYQAMGWDGAEQADDEARFGVYGPIAGASGKIGGR